MFKRVGLRLKEDRLHEIRSGSLHGRSIVALGFGFAVTAQMLKGRSCGGRLHTAKSIVRVAGEGGTDGTLMRGSSTSIIFAKLKHETRHVLRRSSLACFKNAPNDSGSPIWKSACCWNRQSRPLALLCRHFGLR